MSIHHPAKPPQAVDSPTTETLIFCGHQLVCFAEYLSPDCACTAPGYGWRCQCGAAMSWRLTAESAWFNAGLHALDDHGGHARIIDADTDEWLTLASMSPTPLWATPRIMMAT